MADIEVLEKLKQRPPFLFVDKIISRGEGWIKTSKQLTGKEDFFQGHFPGRPIFPGVLLLEAAFQSGALLMINEKENPKKEEELGVVTRVDKVKYKNLVGPTDLLEMEVGLVEKVSDAYYFKAKILTAGKLACSLEFACKLIKN